MINEKILIHTDSQAEIKALNSNKFSSALTLECWESLNKLSHSNEVNVIWVPDHTGVPGNKKRVDWRGKEHSVSTWVQNESLVFHALILNSTLVHTEL